MSYDLAVWHPSRRTTDAESDELYGQLCDGVTDGVVAHPAVKAFYRELTARHPEIDDVPEERIDDTDLCPWSVAMDRSPGHVIINCVWSKAEYVHSLVTGLADKHGLAVYDPQESKTIYPRASSNGAGQSSRPWWKLW